MTVKIRLAVFILFLSSAFEQVQAYTANQVLFEFLNTGRYRVHVKYTVPALKEFREAYVDFNSKKEAEKFYFDMIRGADFYYSNPKKREFVNEALKPEVW